VRIFNIQADVLRDQAKLASPVSSLAFTPSQLLLCKDASRALHLFNNLLAIQGVRPPCPCDPVVLEHDLDATDYQQKQLGLTDEQEKTEEASKDAEDVNNEEGLMRRSDTASLPQQRQLLHLAEIKARNTVQANKPKDIPFFLPTTLVDGQVQFRPTEAAEKEVAGSTLAKVGSRKQEESQNAIAEFFGLLAVEDWRGVMKLLKDQTASGFHVILASLTASEAAKLVPFFHWLVTTGEEGDLGQVWLALFLKEHGGNLGDQLKDLAEAVQQKEEQLTSLCNRVNCFARMIINAEVLL
jgi:hypothetical protein